MITLLNDARRNADKKPLGYLNHVIYKVRFSTEPFPSLVASCPWHAPPGPYPMTPTPVAHA